MAGEKAKKKFTIDLFVFFFSNFFFFFFLSFVADFYSKIIPKIMRKVTKRFRQIKLFRSDCNTLYILFRLCIYFFAMYFIFCYTQYVWGKLLFTAGYTQKVFSKSIEYRWNFCYSFHEIFFSLTIFCFLELEEVNEWKYWEQNQAKVIIIFTYLKLKGLKSFK